MMVMTEIELEELKVKSLLRQRQKTNLVEHQVAILKMMELDISLPVVLDWLVAKKSICTTLPALRRFVKKAFGQKFYDEFTNRNGWQKNKQSALPKATRLTSKFGAEVNRETQLDGQVSLVGLSQKQLREKRADKFINLETTNPLLKNLKDKK